MPTKPTARRCVICGKANTARSGGAFFHSAEIDGRQRSLPTHLACYRRWIADGAIVPPASNLAAWLARASAPPAPRIERTPEDVKRFRADMSRIGAIIGRPSAIRGKSASVTFRLTPNLRGRLEARAQASGLSLSDAIAMVLDAGLAVPSDKLSRPAAAQASALAGAMAVTDLAIAGLRDAAEANGDRKQVRICDRALAGIAKDRAACARVLADWGGTPKEGGRP